MKCAGIKKLFVSLHCVLYEPQRLLVLKLYMNTKMKRIQKQIIAIILIAIGGVCIIWNHHVQQEDDASTDLPSDSVKEEQLDSAYQQILRDGGVYPHFPGETPPQHSQSPD